MTDIGIEGDSNRAAGRDYIEITLAGQEREPLAQAQRKRLNDEVASLALDLKVEGWELWRTVHERTGVKNIGEIKKDQFQDAMNALQAVRERHQEQARAQTLITELEQATAEKDIADLLARYCRREFGDQDPRTLSIKQLTQALRYVDEYQAPAPQVLPLSWPGFRMLAASHPWHISAVALAGVVVGKIF